MSQNAAMDRRLDELELHDFLANREEKAEQLCDDIQSLVTTIETLKNVDAALCKKIENLYTAAKEIRANAKETNNILKRFEAVHADLANKNENCKVNIHHIRGVLNSILEKRIHYFDTHKAFILHILCHWRIYATSRQSFADNIKTGLECWTQQFVTSCNNHLIEIKQRKEEEILFLKDFTEPKVSTEKQIDQNDIIIEQIFLCQVAINGIQKRVESLANEFSILQSKCKASKEEIISNLSTINKLKCVITNLCSFTDKSVKKLIHQNDENFSLLKKSLGHFEKNQVSSKSNKKNLLANLDANGAKTDAGLEAFHCLQSLADSKSQFEDQFSKDLSDCMEAITPYTPIMEETDETNNLGEQI